MVITHHFVYIYMIGYDLLTSKKQNLAFFSIFTILIGYLLKMLNFNQFQYLYSIDHIQWSE